MKQQGQLAVPEERGRSYAPLGNMELCMQTLMTCMTAGDGCPRIGLLYGPSGYGKTVAAAFAAQRTGAAYIEVKSIWGHKDILQAIAREIGVVRMASSAAGILNQVIDALNQFPRPIIVDEADYAVNRRSVEILRDITNSTDAPILLIGEEQLPAKLKEWDRFDNRILIASRVEPLNDDDALILRDYYCNGDIRVSDDLARLFVKRCQGVTRRVVININAAIQCAAEEGLTKIDVKTWGDRQILDGSLQLRRAPIGGRA